MRRLRILVLAAWAAVACGPMRETVAPALVVLAVDGLDPDVLERLMREGRLPHLATLAAASGVVRVTPIAGAEPASTWASAITGVNPGKHGVFDLVTPDPIAGRPRAATLSPREPARWFGRLWREGAAYRPVRAGDPFWTRLARDGIASTMLLVPGTFPPEPVPNGLLLAGTPLPDWAGSWGAAYTWLASDVPPEAVGFTRYGGRRERLVFARNVARATLVGLRAPERVDVPIEVAWNPEARSANITIGDAAVHLEEGRESRWLTITARVGPLRSVRGLVRVRLVKAGTEVQVYVSPIQWHPGAPPSPIAAPAGAAAMLFARLGPFRTLAWPEAGWAFADGVIGEDAFLAAARETFADRAETILNQVDAGGWQLLVAGIETIDTTSRLLWHAIDPGHGAHDPAVAARAGQAIGDAYVRLDTLVGEIRARLPPAADLIVFSPYGLYTARHVVDLNRWLTDRGWLHWGSPPPPVTLAALADAAAWADSVDRSRTAARAMGAGRIYVRLRGRDPDGIVEPGPGYDRLLAEIREGLEALTDPLSGRRVVARVREGRAIFPGPFRARAPDLVVTFSPGYRVSWDTLLGGMSGAVVARNLERWSAEHASVDEAVVPGAWVSTRPLASDTISALDIAPTILQHFGRPAPADADGAAQLRTLPSNASRR